MLGTQPTGPVFGRPDDKLRDEQSRLASLLTDCFAVPVIGRRFAPTHWLAMTESAEMLTKTQHLFDDATRVTAGDSRWQGRTSDDYWAFVGPFGGATAATILRALIDHPQRSGDPLSVTVNFCALIPEGAFDLDVRLIQPVDAALVCRAQPRRRRGCDAC